MKHCKACRKEQQDNNRHKLTTAVTKIVNDLDLEWFMFVCDFTKDGNKEKSTGDSELIYIPDTQTCKKALKKLTPYYKEIIRKSKTKYDVNARSPHPFDDY